METIDRIKFLVSEASGALGDLGTFIPFVISAISINNLSPSSVFSTYGVAYLFSGLFYGLPMAVQPMKAASAYAISYELTPGAIAAASIAIGIILLVLWASGAVKWLVKHTPASVSIGIQTALGISLVYIGIKFIMQQLLLGLILLIIMFLLFQKSRLPTAIVALILGILLGYTMGLIKEFPVIVPGFHLPEINLPEVRDLFSENILTFVLIQIPLTLTNAVIATCALSHDIYPGHKRVNANNLSASMGVANVFSGSFGGMPMCHGSGGVAAHYKFGARTALAPIMLGSLLIITGLFFGESGLEFLKIIPIAVIGCLLFYSGFELAGVFKNMNKEDRSVALLVVVMSLATNPALGVIVGVLVHYVFKYR